MKVPEESGFYVYLLECSDQSYYCGWTSNLAQRLLAHNEGRGAKYTRGRRPCTLVYYESLDSKAQAMQREYRIKQLSRQEKYELITTSKNRGIVK